MIDQAFELLPKYNWGDDPKALRPIDEAIVASQNDKAGRKDIEDRLLAVLNSDATRDGKDYVCRKLKVIGTEVSVSTLAGMLSDENHSHMARYALESMPNAAAGKALRDALGTVSGKLKVGVISSLGVREDNESVSTLASLVGESDPLVATAAARALAAIRTPAAAKALASVEPNVAAENAVVDATLACAERMLASGDKANALAIYKRLSKESSTKHVKLAATRGMLACAGG